MQRVIESARDKLGVAFTVGAELEFVLFRCKGDAPAVPVDYSVFASMITLDEQEGFLTTFCKWMDALDVEIAQVHGESAPGQVEIVLVHQDDPLRLADHVVLAREVRLLLPLLLIVYHRLINTGIVDILLVHYLLAFIFPSSSL